MTAIVGLFCTDGVVVGTDSSTTFTAGQFRTIEQISEKIHIIDNHVIVAGTGAVGLTQRVCAVVQRIYDGKGFNGSEIEISKRICRESLEDFNQTYMSPKGYAAIVAFPIQHKAFLCELALDSLQPELKTHQIWYCSMGSGQMITDPFLGFIREVFWETGPPTVQGGVFAVTWTLDHVINLNPGGVNAPINIAVLERVDGKFKARILEPTELDQHRQNVSAAKAHLREFPKKLEPSAAVGLPDVPKSPM